MRPEKKKTINRTIKNQNQCSSFQDKILNNKCEDLWQRRQPINYIREILFNGKGSRADVPQEPYCSSLSVLLNTLHSVPRK